MAPSKSTDATAGRGVILAPLRWLIALRWRYRLILLGMAFVLGLPAFMVWNRERETRREASISEASRRLNLALAAEDAKAAEASLVRLTDLTRRDPAIVARLDALRRGEAQPGDLPMAQLLLNEHLAHQHWEGAGREAEKIIAMAPGDMLARGVLARQAILAGNTEAGRLHLSAIANPHDAPDGATPGALLLVIELKRSLGEDDSELLSFIAMRMMPLLKSRRADRLPPLARLQLVQCYHLACDALDRYPELAGYWASTARHITDLGGSMANTTTLAMLREHHLAILYRLRKRNRLSETEATSLVADFERQVQDSWASAHDFNKADPIPYAGLALASQRAGKNVEAAKWLDRGLKWSSNPRALYLLVGQLLRDNDPLAGASILEEAYRRYPDDTKIQQSFAELAAAAGRPDRALETCRAVRAKHPDLPWACRLEAAICLDAGRPTQSLEALAPLQDKLRRDAAATELSIRAACAVGADTIAAEMFKLEPKDTAEADAYVGGVRGYLKANRADAAVELASRLVNRFPDHRAARFVRAEGLHILAEAGDTAHWPAERVREALEAYEWLRRREPDNCQVAQRIAWLQLKGLNAPDLALQSVAPLRNQESVRRLTPEMAETLGATLLANDQAEAALSPLRAAINAAPTRTGPYISRAAAFARLGKFREACADLDRAAALPRTPRQAAEWQRVFEMLRGDS